jgi:hypothetical protein
MARHSLRRADAAQEPGLPDHCGIDTYAWNRRGIIKDRSALSASRFALQKISKVAVRPWIKIIVDLVRFLHRRGAKDK